ncbi:SKI/SNO/DAC family protein [Aphelenchoides avenae]|nr:SKI/SNO/DAC family protein [Aphelenchus avenae]
MQTDSVMSPVAMGAPNNPEHSDILMQDLERLIRQQRYDAASTSQGPHSVPMPVMLQPDNISSGLKSTRLGAHLISCFVVGGECRLCYPQVLAMLLHDVPQRTVDEMQTKLGISNLQATGEQVEVMKVNQVIPMNMSRCPLITKTNAERLIASLKPSASPQLSDEQRNTVCVKVEHDCFGGCEGNLYPELNIDNCFECATCLLSFTPEEFVTHSHADPMERVCHWGFDSANWRYYVRVHDSMDANPTARAVLEQYVQHHDARQQALAAFNR